MSVTPFDTAANIAKGVRQIERVAREHHAKLIVFPESTTTGFGVDCTVRKLYDTVDTIPGRMTDAICAKAAQEKVHVVWSTYERARMPDTVYNTVVFIGDNGEILGTYRKTHLFFTENPDNGGWTTRGNETVVVDTPIAKFGIICCYDGDFPELSRALAMKGAEVIVRPSAFMRPFPIWELTNRARAYDNHVYVVATNAVGKDALGNTFRGGSMIVNPLAETIAVCGGDEEIISAELDPDPLVRVGHGNDGPMMFNHMEDRNVASYRDILQSAKTVFPRTKRPGNPD